MTKPKSRTPGKYPPHRRTTFKKHSKRYLKVYTPYLPVVIGLLIGVGVLFADKLHDSKSVLSYAPSISSSSLLDQTNQRRTQQDIGKLAINQTLARAAQSKAEDMAARNYWSHQTPDGKQPWYFVKKAGYEYSRIAENLAYGFNSSKDTINGWMNSSGHRTAMLGDDFSDVGFGIANVADYQGKGEETIVVAFYGKPSTLASNKVEADFSDKVPTTISFIQTLSGGSWPWINFLSGLLIGVIAMYLIAKHSLKLRRKIRHGEEYILRHPALDMSLLALLVLLILLSQTAGFIH
ncbi:MAG TPA: CAP domain-containing protein [Candidatus Saccharimonadales bacterium]|nr:CAP domain-containing protein [Candidatus Saccharimonadales bacterium]